MHEANMLSRNKCS